MHLPKILRLNEEIMNVPARRRQLWIVTRAQTGRAYSSPPRSPTTQ